MDEFIIEKPMSKKISLNRDIEQFRIEHPEYEVYSITPITNNSMWKGKFDFLIIWRLK